MRFFGKVGYGVSVEDPDQNGVWEDTITERSYYGDVVRNHRRLTTGVQAEINSDLTISNSIEIVADPYALENFFAIRYVEWSGRLWIVTDIEARPPRLILQLGGVYNGPTPTPPADSGGGAG